MTSKPVDGARPPIGAMIVCGALGLLWLGVAVWAFTRELPVLAVIWLAIGTLFDFTAALLAARRRAAIVTVWLAVALVVGLRVLVALRSVDGLHLPGANVPQALGIALVVGVALWISRPSLRETLR